MRELADARQNGAKLVVIDPRLNPIACFADIFAQPYPGTDGALGWGLISHLIQTKNYDSELVEKYAVGFEKMARYAEQFTPEKVEDESGIYGQVVEDIADLIVRHRPKISIFPGAGLEHHDNGVNTVRALASLGCLCGALDVGAACSGRKKCASTSWPSTGSMSCPDRNRSVRIDSRYFMSIARNVTP